MTKAELARDLAISQAYVRKLEIQGLIVMDGEEINAKKTIKLLHMYWVPSAAWWDKEVGAVGKELRRRWNLESMMALR